MKYNLNLYLESLFPEAPHKVCGDSEGEVSSEVCTAVTSTVTRYLGEGYQVRANCVTVVELRNADITILRH